MWCRSRRTFPGLAARLTNESSLADRARQGGRGWGRFGMVAPSLAKPRPAHADSLSLAAKKQARSAQINRLGRREFLLRTIRRWTISIAPAGRPVRAAPEYALHWRFCRSALA